MLCDEHERPASREVWWIEDPRGRDEQGRTAFTCETPGCHAGVLAWIEATGGAFVQVVDLAPAPAAGVAA